MRGLDPLFESHLSDMIVLLPCILNIHKVNAVEATNLQLPLGLGTVLEFTRTECSKASLPLGTRPPWAKCVPFQVLQ